MGSNETAPAMLPQAEPAACFPRHDLRIPASPFPVLFGDRAKRL
jgi:hypothetical protein